MTGRSAGRPHNPVSRDALLSVAREVFAEHGYDPKFGARPMARLVEQKLKKPLARALVFDGLAGGATVKVTVKDDEIVLAFPRRSKA